MSTLNLNYLEKQFFSKALIRGGLFLLEPGAAADFIVSCQRDKVRILGIDTFFIFEKGTQPSLKNSITYSQQHELNESFYKNALHFVEKRKKLPNIYFEVVTNI